MVIIGLAVTTGLGRVSFLRFFIITFFFLMMRIRTCCCEVPGDQEGTGGRKGWHETPGEEFCQPKKSCQPTASLTTSIKGPEH